MKILLFGVSQVGKSTVAKVLAKKLNCIFIDPDYYIIDKFGSVEEFQKIYSDTKERYKVKTDIIITLCKENDNIVIPVSPIYSIKVRTTTKTIYSITYFKYLLVLILLKKYLLSISIANTPIPYTAVIGP